MSRNSDGPLRILHCIHSLSGGGAENQLRILTSVSHTQGMISAIFCVNGDRHQIRTDHVRIFRCAGYKKFNLSVFVSLSRAIDEFNPHIIHTWLPASLTMPAMLIAALRRLPCVFSYRSAMHFHRPLTVPEFMCAVFLASQIVSNNPVDNSQRLYRWLYRTKKGIHIGNAVDVKAEFTKATSAPKAGSGHFTVLYAGRLVPEKNWRCVIEAINLLRTSLRVHLWICGEGPEHKIVDAVIADLQLSSQIEVLGFRSDLHALMQRSDAFVLPSWFEGMPNVLLEAMAIGVPAIVSDIPSHRQIVGTSGCAHLFNPASPDELAQRIHQLATSDKPWTTMVEAGRRLAASHTPDRLAEQYKAMYEHLLTRRVPPESARVREMTRTTLK